MNYKKPFYFQKLPKKLNNFYKNKNRSNLKVSNKSKNKKILILLLILTKVLKIYQKIINKSFPEDSIIGEEFEDKKTRNDFMWSIDPIDGTRAFVIGAPTWSNLISLSFKKNQFQAQQIFLI